MSEQNTPQNEEVDLGQLFKLIGNMFNNLFNFIGSIFKGAFKFFILVLVQLYRGLIWYIAAVVIGAVAGYFIDESADNMYAANLYIETNFDSARQVYENMENLHQLAYMDKDSVELADVLGLTIKQASTLEGFYISPDFDENDMITQFADYKMDLDSVTRLEANYLDFKDNLSYYNFNMHKIGVASTDKFIFGSLQKKLSEYISKNAYIEVLRDVTLENYDRETTMLDAQTVELDSLTKEYFKIRVTESRKEPVPGAGTNLFLAGGDGQNNLLVDESKLVAEKYALETRKRAINVDKVKKQNIINIIADFPKSGYDISRWYDKMKFVLPIVLFALSFIGSLAILLLNYLKKQDVLLTKKGV